MLSPDTTTDFLDLCWSLGLFFAVFLAYFVEPVVFSFPWLPIFSLSVVLFFAWLFFLFSSCAEVFIRNIGWFGTTNTFFFYSFLVEFYFCHSYFPFYFLFRFVEAVFFLFLFGYLNTSVVTHSFWSDNGFIKGYLHYETKSSQIVSFEAEVKNFFIS